MFKPPELAPLSVRQKKAIIKVVDQDNSPIQGAIINYKQTSLDFMFSTGWRWQGDTTPPELINKINEIGFNTGHILAFYEWEGVQPEQGIYHWQGLDHAFDTFGTTLPAEDTFPHYRHRYVSLGPSFGQLSAAPGWVDIDNLYEFREQYGDYLQEFLIRYRGRVKVYSVFGELEGAAYGLSIEETIAWAKWQTDLIREIDPEAMILIQVGDMHWYFPDEVEIQIEQNTFMPKWRILEMLMAAGVDFDGLAVEAHYSMATPGDWHQFIEAIELLTASGKYLYIWEIYYPSCYNPCLYFNWQDRALTPKQMPAEWPYPPDTYTEAWQKDQVENTLHSLIENDRVLGINYGTLAGANLMDGLTNTPGVGFGQDLCSQPSIINLGLLHSDFSPKPSFMALRDYWWSLFANGEVETDADGEAAISGLPGEYELTIVADGYEQQRTDININKNASGPLGLVIRLKGSDVEEQVSGKTTPDSNSLKPTSLANATQTGLVNETESQAEKDWRIFILPLIIILAAGGAMLALNVWEKRKLK